MTSIWEQHSIVDIIKEDPIPTQPQLQERSESSEQIESDYETQDLSEDLNQEKLEQNIVYVSYERFYYERI